MKFRDYIKPDFVVVLGLATLVFFPLESRAQYNPQQKKTYKAANIDKPEILSQKVSINGLPEYSGKQKFISGTMSQTSIGPQYSEQFVAMEPAQQIVEWYKGALTGYKWNITDSDPGRVQAKKIDGAYIQITANPYKSADGRSLVRINYHDHHLKSVGGE